MIISNLKIISKYENWWTIGIIRNLEIISKYENLVGNRHHKKSENNLKIQRFGGQ
jgi:hypothetical protein